MMKAAKLLLFLLIVFVVTACQGLFETVTNAGDDRLVWPLPPVPARLRYEQEIELSQRATTTVGLLTGMHDALLTIQPHRVSISKDILAVVDRQTGAGYVIDRYRNSVIELKYTDETKPQYIGESKVIHAMDVAVDDMKRVYLLDSTGRQVIVFQDNGRFIRKFGAGVMWGQPDRIAIDEIRQRVYVTDTFQRRIYVFSVSGVFLYTFGDQGKEQGRFDKLVDIAVDSVGNLYVLEAMPLRIQVFDSLGKYIKSISLDKQEFREPVAITVESNQFVYIADSYQNMVMLMDMQGRTILKIGGLGRRLGKFSDLSDLDFDQQWQRLVTAETSTARLQLMRRTAEDWSSLP